MILTVEVYVVLALIAIKYCFTFWLERLNAENVRANSAAVPQAFADMIEEGDYFKSVRYTLDKIRFSAIDSDYGALILALILLFGIFPHLFYAFTSLFGTSVWGQSLALCFTVTVVSLPSLPMEWYSQFVIEQRYGFNKSSFGLWSSDKVKEFVIGMLFGVPLLALILWLFGIFRDTWWIWAFGAIAIFQLLMLIIYPRFIMPLFNKLSPLEDGELRDVLLSMADRAGFKANTIYVMDGSKRSSHSNAFFTGFGKFRRIVLFDTLISQLSTAEIEAVLAHEIGHYKLGHIPKMIASSFVMLFFGLAAVAYLARQPWFYEGFGFKIKDGMAPVLILFSALAPLFTFYFTPIFNGMSRKFEYEADAFAKRVCNGKDALVAAVRKLHTKNLGNLTPHKIYSAVYYSHPTLLEREAALSEERK